MVLYSVDTAIFEKVPGYRRLVLLAKGVSNPPDNAALNLALVNRITETASDKEKTIGRDPSARAVTTACPVPLRALANCCWGRASRRFLVELGLTFACPL